MKVAYQGLEGSYSHEAVTEFNPDFIPVSHRSFDGAVTAVQEGKCDLAFLPVENSTAGRVMEVHNILYDSGLHIIGEHLSPIHHCLMVPRKAFRSTPDYNMTKDELLKWKSSGLTKEEKDKAYNQIIEVQSHTQALAQCRNYLSKKIPKAVSIPVFDTAGAAQAIARNSDSKIAAIASQAAADTYGMILLEKNIEDIKTNTTRFLLLSKEPNSIEDIQRNAITTLVFETCHDTGALLKALEVFEKENINMTKIETYMSGPERPNPAFYVDLSGSIFEEHFQKCLNELKEKSNNIKILGCYDADIKRSNENGFLSI